MFTFPYAKKLLILGGVLFTTGVVMVAFLLSFPQVETAYQATFDMTTKGWYSSDKFRAEGGYWLDLDVSSTGPSILHVVGQTVGEIFKVEGSTYKYSVPIPRGDVYQVQVENKAGHYELLFFWTPDENRFSGNFCLKRRTANFYQLVSSSVTMFVITSAIVPSVIYMEYRARQRAKSTYGCPRCDKTVSIGLEKCPYCKIDLTKYWVRCKYCKKLYDSHFEECPRCGASTED